VNIKKVAEMAGVSVATISRVLNHPERVLPETRENVLRIIREQDYTPNWFARGLNLARTDTIALLVPNIDSGPHQQIISGIETVAYNKENAVFLCNTRNDPDGEYNYLRRVISRRVDGIVLVSSLLQDRQMDILASTDIPAVHIGSQRLSCCRTSCRIDLEEGVYRLTEHLIVQTHRRIDLLLEDLQNPEHPAIIGGFRKALDRTGATGNIHYGPHSVQGGYITATKLARTGNLPDALVTISDEQAFGVMKAARDLDIAIPERLALASMNDSDMCSIVTPAVTSLEQPALRLGMVAARMLFDEIEHDELEPIGPQEVILQPTLKIRHSCGNRKYIYELQD
jgi:LacI family transcriptional regulator